MNKIELVTLQHSLECESARLTHERIIALYATSDGASAQRASNENALPLPESVTAYHNAVDLLLSL